MAQGIPGGDVASRRIVRADRSIGSTAASFRREHSPSRTRTPASSVQQRWFERTDGLPFFFAGIWRPWVGDRGTKRAPNVGNHMLFSITMTKPNGVVVPIYEKTMPAMLMTPERVARWLDGGSAADALEMQMPAPEDAVVVRPLKMAA